MLHFLADRRNQLLLVVILTFLAYVNIFTNQFVIDDETFIVDWQEGKSFANVGKFFTGSVPAGHEGVYRPVRSIFYALYSPIFRGKPFGYHLHSMAVHLGSTVLVYLIVEQLVVHSSWFNQKQITTNYKLRAKRTTNYSPFIAALLFGLHPVHTETITYIASSMEAIGPLFMLASIYLYLLGKKYYWASVALATLAYFSNEVTLILPLVLISADFCLRRRRGLARIGTLISADFVKRYLPYIIPAVFYLAIRFFVIHAVSRGPYLADSVYLTFLTMMKVFVKYLALMVLPVNLANNHVISGGIEAFVYRDYRTQAIRAQSLLDPGILLWLVILGILGVMGVYFWKRVPIVTFGILWFLIALLPASNIVPQGSILNEKLLYIPSIGLILILSYFIAKLITSGYRTIGLCILFLISSFYLFSTWHRNSQWHDNISIWSSDINTYPEDNAYAYFQLGNAYSELGAVDTAVENYNRSFAINPQFVVALGSIAKTYESIGRNDLALDFYNRALSVNPYFLEAYLSAGNIFQRRADFDLAALAYEQILKVDPNAQEIKQLRASLPEIREATLSSKVAQENLWLRHHSVLNELSLSLPSTLSFKDLGNRAVISDSDGFEIEISFDTKKIGTSEEEYVSNQKEKYGELVNQGLAQVPGWDKAYVRVWSSFAKATDDKQNGQNQLVRLEFFLFKTSKVIKVLVSDPSQQNKGIVDLILGSIKIE